MTALTFSPEDRRRLFHLKADIPVPDAELRGLKVRAGAALAERVPAVAGIARGFGLGGTVRPLSGGTFHVVHAVEGGPRPVVVRSALPGLFLTDLSLGLEREARGWLSAVAGQDLVPETMAVAFEADGAPFDHAVLDRVAQPVLRDAGDALLDDRPELGASIGALLATIHAVTGDGAGLLDMSQPGRSRPSGVHAAWRDYVLLRLADHLDTCLAAGATDGPSARRIGDLFAGLAGHLDGRPMRLLHGDPGNHNLVVDPATAKAVGILDWEDALVGDPLFDLALWATFHPERRWGAALQGYGLGVPMAETALLFALYFLRIALAKSVHRIRFGVVDLPGRSPAHDRIRRGLEMVEQWV